MRVRQRQTKLHRPWIALPNFSRAYVHSRRFTVRVVYFYLWTDGAEPGGTRHKTKLIIKAKLNQAKLYIHDSMIISNSFIKVIIVDFTNRATRVQAKLCRITTLNLLLCQWSFVTSWPEPFARAARGHQRWCFAAARAACVSPNQVLTHATRAAAKQLNKHLFLATNMCVRARATARRNNSKQNSRISDEFNLRHFVDHVE